MSGIYIPNMEMPTECPCRLVGSGYDVWCFAAYGIPARVKEYDECCENGTKPSWCPLVAVPDHGRLIDGDELEQKMKSRKNYVGRLSDADCLVADAPTIIEAENNNG